MRGLLPVGNLVQQGPVEARTAILIFVPIFAPIVSAIGVHPIHFRTMVVYALSAAGIKSPVGNVLVVGARIAGLEIEPVIRRLLPFLLSIFIGLFVVVFIPQISLAIPGALEML